jgi:signal transduction histidine kinase
LRAREKDYLYPGSQSPVTFMSRPTQIRAALVLGAVIAGSYLWLGTAAAIQLDGQNRPPPKAIQPATEPINQINYFLHLLEKNQHVVVYGGIASIGILMMGIAIGSASSAPQSKNDTQLEILKQEKEKAENLAKLKAEFLNQVSHELRTPLAVIIGYIECITDGLYGEIENKHQEILQVVAKQSSHLKNMIDQILIYSRLEAAKQPMRIEELPLNKLIADMRETFDFLCRQKGLELHWELPHSSIEIRSDAVRVKEVISNLLQNAVKYTDRGSITVRVITLAQSDSIAVEVEDTGMGIAEHQLPNIFDPFMQAHKTSSENSRGGIGLGLSIVKKHVEQIKGTISVKSELGKGSTFKIVLPYNFDKPVSRGIWPFNRFARKQPLIETVPVQQANSTRQKRSETSHALS